MSCECHKINWMAVCQGPDYKYVMVDGSTLQEGVDCQDKVNQYRMDYDTYLRVCKYQPGEDGTLFPDEVYQEIIKVKVEPTPPIFKDSPPICQK